MAAASRPTRVLSSVVALVCLGCGGSASEGPPPPMETSPAETGMVAHAETPTDVAVDVDRRFDAFAPRVLDCVPDRASLALELRVRRSGTVVSVLGDDLGDARACVRNALVGTAVSGPLTSEMLVRHTFVRPPAAPEHVVTPTAPSPVPAEDPTRATFAALVDAHAAEILTCAGRALAAVRVHWDEGGHVTLSFQGDLAGSPEESCMRDALGAPTIAPGTTGELVRLVRAPSP